MKNISNISKENGFYRQDCETSFFWKCMPEKISSVAEQGCIFFQSDSEISQITNYIKNQYWKQPEKTLIDLR